jgi:hypothetical protein
MVYIDILLRLFRALDILEYFVYDLLSTYVIAIKSRNDWDVSFGNRLNSCDDYIPGLFRVVLCIYVDYAVYGLLWVHSPYIYIKLASVFW